MRKYSSHFQHKTDAMSEEMVAAMLSEETFDFHALFRVVHQALRGRNAAAGGEETLRLRVYEKLQNFVKQGLVQKKGKQYAGVVSALHSRSIEMAAARVEINKRKSASAQSVVE